MTEERLARVVSASDAAIDWVAAYTDLRWRLTLERAAVTLGLRDELVTLLSDLYGRLDAGH
jgi:hypothetical protein